MIYLDKYNFTAMHFGGRVISAVYNGAYMVWQAIRSCFGAGFWKNNAPWLNTDGWKNN